MKLKETDLCLGKFLWCAFIVIFSTTSCTVFTWHPVIEKSGFFPLEKTRDELSIIIKRSFERDTHIAEDFRKSNKEKVLSLSDWEYKTLRKALEHYSSATIILDGTQPEPAQTFVSILLFYNYEASYSHKGWCELSFMTGGIIPCFGDLSVHDAEYFVYKDHVLQKKYAYRYTRKGAYWLGLLPFVWMNLFTNTQEDALASTALQFLRQAEKDGFL